jgi:hypothetical protein
MQEQKAKCSTGEIILRNIHPISDNRKNNQSLENTTEIYYLGYSRKYLLNKKLIKQI